MIIYDGNSPIMGLVVAIGILIAIVCVIISIVKR